MVIEVRSYQAKPRPLAIPEYLCYGRNREVGKEKLEVKEKGEKNILCRTENICRPMNQKNISEDCYL